MGASSPALVRIMWSTTQIKLSRGSNNHLVTHTSDRHDDGNPARGAGRAQFSVISFFGNMVTWHYHIRSRHRHVWACQKMMSGPILKSQEPSWRLASKTGVAPKKPLILTKTTHFQKKSAPAARYGDACGAPTGRGAHYTNL